MRKRYYIAGIIILALALVWRADSQVQVSSPIPVNTSQIGGSAVVADPCQQQAKSFFAASLTGSAQIITGTSGKYTYICAWNDMNGGTAQNYAVVEGTGTTCATGTAAVGGLSGGTTAATGWNVAANGGRVIGNGSSTIAKAANASGDNICVLQSGSAELNVAGGYVQQ